MPTSHRRHAITETDEIGDALKIAERTWPTLADRPAALLRQLILVGRDALAHGQLDDQTVRRDAIHATSGVLAGAFGPDYLQKAREDWPE
jgi:hypothetical protein